MQHLESGVSVPSMRAGTLKDTGKHHLEATNEVLVTLRE